MDDMVMELKFLAYSEGREYLIIVANEIQRLQAEVNLWMGVAERLAESHPQFEAFRYYFGARTKAVRHGV